MPPQNIEAERAVLGAMLIDPTAISKIIDLESHAFYDVKHQHIHKAAQELADDGIGVDSLTLSEKLQEDGLLDRVGGAYYITGLSEELPSAANVEHYAQIVMENHRRREGIAIASEIVQEMYAKTEDVDDSFDKLLRLLTKEYSGLSPLYSGLKEAMAMAQRVLDSGEIVGMPMGFPSLDKMTGGISYGDYYVLGGRPSMGKTAFAITVGKAMARNGRVVSLFSMETKIKDIALRYIAQETLVDISAMRGGELSDETFKAMKATQADMAGLPVFIDDTGTQTLRSMRAKIEAQQRDTGVDVVIVDYMQLMSGSRQEGPVAQTTEYSKGLKAIAMDLNVGVIALSQMSRKPETRTVPRPIISDLRESGAIEQDADAIILLYRPEKYDIMTEPKGMFAGRDNKNLAEVILGKNRNGPTGTIEMNFFGEKMIFTERAPGFRGEQPPADQEEEPF